MNNQERIEDLTAQAEEVAKKLEQFQILHLKLQGAIEILNVVENESEDKSEQKKTKNEEK